MENEKNNTRSLTARGLTVLALILAAVVITSPVSCVMHRNAQIAKMVAAGADPITARCAIVGSESSGDLVVCALASGRAK